MTLASVAVSSAWYVVALLLIGAGLAAQYRRGVVKELRESLKTASTEIEIHRGIVDRLESKIDALDARCTALEVENKSLRGILATGTHLAPVIEVQLTEIISLLKEHERLATKRWERLA